MKRYGIVVETFQSAGRYHHKVYDIGVKPDRIGELSNDVIEVLKKVNEKVWEDIPEGATGLVSKIIYKCPKIKR